MENVDVHIRGTQIDCDGEADKIEVKTEARYCIKKNSIYLLYDESEATGMEGAKTNLRIESDRIVMIRKGAVETRMEFVEGESTEVLYKCPHGIFDMNVDTKEIAISYQGEKIKNISIKYSMCFEDDYTTENSLCIDIK